MSKIPNYPFNVGPLFLCFVPSLNDDVCEPFALKKIRITHVDFKTNLLCLSFNKSIDMLKITLFGKGFGLLSMQQKERDCILHSRSVSKLNI